MAAEPQGDSTAPRPGDAVEVRSGRMTTIKLSRARLLQRLQPQEGQVERLPFREAFFNFDSAVILPAPPGERGLHLVLEALRHLKNNPGRTLLVAGHTDTVGTRDYNQRLSSARARDRGPARG